MEFRLVRNHFKLSMPEVMRIEKQLNIQFHSLDWIQWYNERKIIGFGLFWTPNFHPNAFTAQPWNLSRVGIFMALANFILRRNENEKEKTSIFMLENFLPCLSIKIYFKFASISILYLFLSFMRNDLKSLLELKEDEIYCMDETFRIIINFQLLLTETFHVQFYLQTSAACFSLLNRWKA